MSVVDVADRDASASIHHDTPQSTWPLAHPTPANDAVTEEAEVSPPPESHPMTATASNSSLNPTQDFAEGLAATYGTRSRHRTGARPNYADDKELDMEIEAAGRIPRPGSRKHNATLSSVDQSTGRENNSPAPRSGFAAINANSAAVNGLASASTDNIPGTSSFSAHPAALAPSKKRKQPGSNAAVVSQSSTYTITKSRGATAFQRAQAETNMMSFERCGSRLNNKKQMIADDSTVLMTNDHAYFICEPPGEPYYLGRIMEFLPSKSEPESDSPIDAVRVNWYYRPKDILRRVQDTRIVFASMHSDICPLTSLRGKCNIQHISDIQNLDHYRTQKDSFWFNSLYDRYMHRYYEVIPTAKVINVPQHVKTVLDERWRFVLVEVGRGRELTSAVKTCKKCSQYSANHDSVDCAVCKNTYHMACIRPPLLKKPARGFAWACAPCSRAQELRLEARNTPTLTDAGQNGEEENLEEEDDDANARGQMTRESSIAPEPHPPPTEAQIAQANLWPYRYLGIHCRVEDALDYDDRIYPRASSRLGPRHQANVNVWHGRPVEMVKPADVKRKYVKNGAHKKDTKLTKEASSALESEKESKLKRPKWIVDEPFGYITRGEDTPIEIKGKKEFTAQLTFKMPDPSKFTDRGGDDTNTKAPPEDLEKFVDEYMVKAKMIAPQYHVIGTSTDFLTKAVEKFQENDYDTEKALAAMKELSIRGDLKQPDLNREEVKRFEEGVAKFGSELHAVARHVSPTIKESRIVRYYYMWKKSDRGRQIWGNFEGRKSKKESKRIEKDGGGGTKLLDDVADDQDDSAFDIDKATEKKRGFECKFCATRKSRQWRRAPGTAPGTLVPADPSVKAANVKDKSSWLTLALCGKCAYLWRRYAIQYESIEEVSKKIAAAGGRASKRKIDEELMRTIVEAQGEVGDPISANTAAMAASAGVDIPPGIIETQEPLKKKPKPDQLTNGHAEIAEKKKIVKEPEPEPEMHPEMPKVMVHPCAVCKIEHLPGDELLKCRDCRLHVHKSCYGIPPETATKPWFCDMCHNDHNTQVSTIYECVLCPVKYTPQELMEPLKVSHKKKSDKERDKERLEREMVQEAGRRWRQEQEQAGRPVNPREALKRTAWNNWVHVICAIWTDEMKFGNAELFDEAEGVGFIAAEKFRQPCVICTGVGKPTVSCFVKECPARFHVGCAHQSEYFFGFEIFLPKGTRREVKPMMQLDGEKGHARPIIYCPSHHPVPEYIHSMLEATDANITALQLYARLYKQVDQSVTATARRAAQFTQNVPVNSGRQNTTSNGTEAAPSPPPTNDLHTEPESVRSESKFGGSQGKPRRRCCTCNVEHSPWWYMIPRPSQKGPSGSQVPNGVQVNGNGQSDQRDPHSQISKAPHRETTSPVLASTTGASEADEPVVPNGVVKVEESSDVIMLDAPQSADGTLQQCHQCHKKGLDPASLSPRRKSAEVVPSREEPPPAPQFYEAPPVHTQPTYPAYPVSHPAESQPHSHPTAPPPVLWPQAPHGHQYPVHSSSWTAPNVRNSASSLASGSPYHHPPPPDYYHHHHRASSGYSMPYSTAPPPLSTSRVQPNGVVQHHSPTMSYGYPYGPPPSGQNNPFPYGPPIPSQPEPRPRHSREHSMNSPHQRRAYSTGPPPPPPLNGPNGPYRQTSGSSMGATSQNLSQIAQSAEAQMGGGSGGTGLGIGGFRRESVESNSNGNRRPSTPNDHDREREKEGEREGGVNGSASAGASGSGGGRVASGASASPNLRNLLG